MNIDPYTAKPGDYWDKRWFQSDEHWTDARNKIRRNGLDLKQHKGFLYVVAKIPT